MSKRYEKFFELDRQFSKNEYKFSWWNGAEFGTTLGMFATVFTGHKEFWILFSAFCVEIVFALYYQTRGKKILREMKNLVDQDK